MRLLLLSRIGTLTLVTSFFVNLLALLELRNVQLEERRLQKTGREAIREVSLVRAELLAMQKLVAVYVANPDSRLLIHYYDIVELHAGLKSFTTAPQPSYWDNLLADASRSIPTVNTDGKPLQERLRSLDIAGDNRLLTVNLLETSRRLRERERIIFAAAQGLYDTRKQQFVSEAPVSPSYATGVMYDPVHLQLTNEIEGHLNTLFDQINLNIEGRTLLMQDRITQASTLLLLLSVISGIILLLLIWLLRVGILKPIEQIASAAGMVAEGDYSATIQESRVVEEIGVLAHAMNRMIRAVRFDLMQKDLARRATEAMYRAEQAKEKAELETRIKSRFLANMTHELRTPLNAVIGLSQLLFKTELNGKQANYVGKVVDAGKFLLGLVNDILDFSKAEAGKITLEMKSLNVTDLLESSLSLVTLQAQQKGISARLDTTGMPDADGPWWVKADELRLRQILTNLLSNAVKFTHEGEVCLVARAHRQASGQVQLQIQVRDSGIGMNPEQVAGAFEEFRQADQSTTRLYGGTGLGLTIAKRLVDALQGNILIESTPGQGTTFTLDFLFDAGQAAYNPIASRNEPATALQAQAMAASLPDNTVIDERPTDDPPLTLSGTVILLVEDNLINQEVARDTLEMEGAIVHICDNGKEAVDYLAHGTQGIELVLMDIEMPIMDGYQATHALRAQYTHHQLPILGMTAHAFEEARDKCLEVGMNNVMTKPFDLPTLAAWIQDNLRDLRKQTDE
jgi:signal transduction histidine kinase